MLRQSTVSFFTTYTLNFYEHLSETSSNFAHRNTDQENIERPQQSNKHMHSERGREGKTERERASRAPAYKAAETSDSTFRSNLQQTDGGRRVCVSGLGELLAASCDITCERGTDLLQQVCAPSLTRSCVGPQMTDRRQALGRLTYIRTALMNVFAQTITSNHRVSGSVVCPCRN